jgi:hypothetical protein
MEYHTPRASSNRIVAGRGHSCGGETAAEDHPPANRQFFQTLSA